MGDCARPYTVPHNGQGLKPSRSENDPTRKIFSTFPINADFSGWPSVRGSSTSWNRSSWNNVGLTMSLTRFTLECSSKLMLSRERQLSLSVSPNALGLLHYEISTMHQSSHIGCTNQERDRLLTVRARMSRLPHTATISNTKEKTQNSKDPAKTKGSTRGLPLNRAPRPR